MEGRFLLLINRLAAYYGTAKPIFFAFIGLLFNQNSFGQSLTGKVLDATSKEPLPFVTVYDPETNKGVNTDLLGKFTWNSSIPKSLKVRFVGYKEQEILNLQSPLTILLVAAPTTTKEVVISKGFNPAVRIVRLATKNAKNNNPENYPHYNCLIHNKFYVGKDPDPNHKIVGAEKKQKKKKEDSAVTIEVSESDSSDFELSKHLDTSHLFFNETIVERNFKRPGNLQEVVKATRTSGFKLLSLTAMATDFQPFSFYNPIVNLLQRDYINPVSRNSEKSYDFTLEGYVVNNGDTSFNISFEPYPDKNFYGFKGVMTINSNGYAIENIIATPLEASMVEFKFQQQYRIREGKWFPDQLHTDMRFLQLRQDTGTNLAGIGRSYVGQVSFKPKRNTYGVASLVVPEGVTNLPDSVWEKYRVIPLENKELTTYVWLDTLIGNNAPELEKGMLAIEYLSTGFIPWGKFRLYLDKFMSINEFEGLRLGAGLGTGNSISNTFEWRGSFAYGTKDGRFKHENSLTTYLSNDKENLLRGKFGFDIFEPGQINASTSNRDLLGLNSFRQFILSRAIYKEEYALDLQTAPFKGVKFSIGGYSRFFTGGNSNFWFLNSADQMLIDAFRLNGYRATLRFTGEEKTYLFKGISLPLSVGYPQLEVVYESNQGLKSELFRYERISVEARHKYSFRKLGNTYLTVKAGSVNSEVPYPLLFHATGGANTAWLQIPEHFQTVGLYEFTSRDMVQLFFNHDFGRLLWKSTNEKFQPKPVLYAAVGWGTNVGNNLNTNVSIQSFDKGIFETGLLFRDLYRLKYLDAFYLTFGAGLFHRSGAYSTGNLRDDLAFRIHIGIDN